MVHRMSGGMLKVRFGPTAALKQTWCHFALGPTAARTGVLSTVPATAPAMTGNSLRRPGYRPRSYNTRRLHSALAYGVPSSSRTITPARGPIRGMIQSGPSGALQLAVKWFADLQYYTLKRDGMRSDRHRALTF
jgi:hypothetical protein